MVYNSTTRLYAILSKYKSRHASAAYPPGAPGHSEQKPFLLGVQCSRPLATTKPGTAGASLPSSTASLSFILSTALGTLPLASLVHARHFPAPESLPVSSAWLLFAQISDGLLSQLPWVSGATFSVRPSLATLSECVSYPSTPHPLSLYYFSR